MSSTAVVFDILAKDRASDKFDHLGGAIDGTSGRMSKFTGMMKSAGKVAAYGLGAGLVIATAAAVDFAKRAAEDETSAALMAKGLQNSSDATDKQIAATERWITKQGQLLGVTDDELRPAITRLATATHDVTEAQDLAQLAMNVSAGTGKSLEAVTNALMKAQLGSVGGLSKLGVATKTQAGNTMTLEAITRKMGETFGGAAATKAGTLQGKMDRLKVIFDETKESIGAKLIPIISDFADVLINKVVPNIAPVASKLGDIAKLGWDKLVSAKDAISDFFNGATGHAAVAASVDAIAGAAKTIAEKFQAAKTHVTEFFDAVEAGDPKQIGTMLGEAVSSALDSLLGLAGTVTAKLSAMFAKVDWVGLGLSFGKQVPALLFGLAVGILAFDPMPILIGIKDHWGDVLIAVLAIAFAPAKIAGGLGKILARIPFVGKFMEHAVIWLNDLGGRLLSFGGDLLAAMWRGFTGGKALPGAGIVIKVLDALKGIPGAVADFFSTLATKLGVWALDAFEAMGKGARTKGGELVSYVGTIPGKILHALGNLGSVLFNAGVSVIQGLISGVTSKISQLEGLFKSITSKIPDWKGPEDKDAILLKPAGVAIMQGLIDGLESGKVKLKTVLDKLTEFISKHQDKLAKLRDKRAGIIDTFKGMTSSVFGMDMTAGENGRPKTVNDLLGFQKAQRDKAERLKGDVNNLTAKGLSKDLINQLMNAGEAGQEQIHLLASANADQIAQLNADNLATQQALQAAGIEASKALGVEQAIKAEERDIKLAQGIKQALKELLDEQDKNTIVELHLDGHKIWWSLKKIKRESGQNLGLD